MVSFSVAQSTFDSSCVGPKSRNFVSGKSGGGGGGKNPGAGLKMNNVSFVSFGDFLMYVFPFIINNLRLRNILNFIDPYDNFYYPFLSDWSFHALGSLCCTRGCQ